MKINKRLFYALVFIIIGALAFFIINFIFISEKSRILKIINEGKAAVEAEDVNKCMSFISLAYSDDYGLRYLIVKRILSETFKAFDGFNISVNNIEIEVDEDNATASFDLWVIVTVQNQPGYLVGTNNAPAKVKMYFTKERLKWQVVKVSGIKAPYL